MTSALSTPRKIKLYYHINNIDSELSSSDFKYTITKSNDNGVTYNEYLNGTFNNTKDNDNLYIMDDYVSENSQPKYKVYLWLNGSDTAQGNIQGKSFSGELRAEINSAHEPSPPDLDDGMIPIVISDTGIVSTISKDSNSWYNYDNKEWANVVLVTSSSRSKYLNTTGVEVNEDDILAYYVWIPRYSYRIWSVDNNSKTGEEQEIEIVFEDKNATKILGTQVGDFRTHPAFTFGDTELNGIWVGKFETTGTADTPTIKPNVQSLRNQNVSTQFATSQKLGTSTYGSTSKVDAHMAKNTEWGAAAYLSHSKYGVNREVYVNNSSSMYTGRSGGNVAGSTAINTVYTDQTSTTKYTTYGFYTWDGYLLSYGTNNKTTTHDISKVASTTGNITGVYDMSGGAWEYTMGYYSKASTTWGATSNDNYAGFSSQPDKKYYDDYTTNNPLTACDGGICYGQALSETNKWYNDFAVFVSAGGPWLIRSFSYEAHDGAGAFYFTGVSYGGNANFGGSFRSVISYIG